MNFKGHTRNDFRAAKFTFVLIFVLTTHMRSSKNAFCLFAKSLAWIIADWNSQFFQFRYFKGAFFIHCNVSIKKKIMRLKSYSFECV